MHRRLGSLGFGILSGWLIFQGVAATQADRSVVVFRNVTIVPMDANRVLAAQAVIVRGSTIAAIGPARTTSVPAGATTIDGTGKFLMPGLADLHVHLPGPNTPAQRTADELFLYLANGITTVRSMAGFDRHLRLRDGVNGGELPGPTLILAGPGLDGQRVKTPEDGEREVRQQKANGFDLVKILPGLSLASYDAIVRTAREVRMPFAGHVPADVGIQHALEGGQETIEHLDGYLELLGGRQPLSTDAMLPIVVRTKQAGAWNVPTMAVMAVNVGTVENGELLARPELEYIAASYADDWLRLRARANIPKDIATIIQTNRMRLLKLLHDQGARLLFGTDSPQLFNVPGFSIHRELGMMADAGMSPYEVLRSGTEQVGAYLKRQCGTVTVGACADLVLLDANPLQDVGNVNRIGGVMVRGRWFSSAEIRQELARIRARPENYHASPR
jgi:imidazolonepropionase-like amidohydrolase